jgi:hypothetical protein
MTGAGADLGDTHQAFLDVELMRHDRQVTVEHGQLAERANTERPQSK